MSLNMPFTADVHLTFVPATGEKSWATAQGQLELNELYQQLEGLGRRVRPRVMRVNGVSSLMGEFSLMLSQDSVSALNAAGVAWLEGRDGRTLILTCRVLDSGVVGSVTEWTSLLSKVLSRQTLFSRGAKE
ncbi:hypothetical protein Pfra02_43730 [Pseudomonas fragi]|nr:hypothetical protein Pfra02_43730 [Pseudomonas fragi]